MSPPRAGSRRSWSLEARTCRSQARPASGGRQRRLCVLRRPVTAASAGRTMAVKTEGAALDCFEVTLKCEEGEDEEEAMVVAVIPRPEPMLRGEVGGDAASASRSGTRVPPQARAGAPPPPPLSGLGSRRPSPFRLGGLPLSGPEAPAPLPT